MGTHDLCILYRYFDPVTVRNNEPKKSAVNEHIIEAGTNHEIELHTPQVISTERLYIPRLVRESIEIKKHPQNFNREDWFKLSQAWNPVEENEQGVKLTGVAVTMIHVTGSKYRYNIQRSLQPQSVHNVMTDCEVATRTADSALQFREEGADAATLVLRAPALLGLLADLERSCDVIELHLSPDHPHLSIVTYGMQDRSCIDVPKSSEMMQSFHCEQPLTLKYQLHHIRLIMKALAISSKVVLRCSANGLLLLQLKLEREDQRQMFSEFTIVPLLDD